MAKRENFIRHSFYTTASPEDFWIEVIHLSLFRASGSKNSPKFLVRERLRVQDFRMASDPFKDDRLLIPHPGMGLSFADSIETLRNKRISGRFIFRGQPAWQITPGPLPEGLVVNYTDKTHPMINVCRVMLESEFISKMNLLVESKRYIYTNLKV